MTDDQYHALMEQMYDVALCINKTDHANKDALERMRIRVQEASPVTILSEGRLHVEYCITNIDTSDDQILRLMTLGFVPGALVSIRSRTGGAMEVGLMGTCVAIRDEEAALITVVRFT
jgi:Fe2+ transport system protein FeoA